MENIIEQLGGYDFVKNKLATDLLFGERYYLEKVLLKYRREHNIFEVGDWVVMLSDTVKKEWEFYQLKLDDMSSHWINLVEFRHATTEEIHAGRRL